jgi:uncharacterized membrane protein
MKLGIIIITAIIILSLIFTLMLAGKSDADYSQSARRNTVNLTVIYAVVILLSIVALGVYIKWGI